MQHKKDTTNGIVCNFEEARVAYRKSADRRRRGTARGRRYLLTTSYTSGALHGITPLFGSTNPTSVLTRGLHNRVASFLYESQFAFPPSCKSPSHPDASRDVAPSPQPPAQSRIQKCMFPMYKRADILCHTQTHRRTQTT
jgi:hypothetical protein